MRNELTEDKVRTKACSTLNFKDNDKAKSDVGQLTTFRQLGFTGDRNNKKPDGWYLPFNLNDVAIILETKNSNEDIKKEKWEKEITDNCEIVLTKYNKVIGILYNGYDVRVFKNNEEVETPQELQDKHFYLRLFTEQSIDKEKIYALTAKINDCLHLDFGIKNLYHRMIFTACALVATRYGAILVKGMDYSTFHQSIQSQLNKSLEKDKQQNRKLGLLTEVYSIIRMNNTENQEAIDNFIEWTKEISELITSDHWNGEDVMGIFFNEFNRYKKKSERGQVFTPDHITSLMYRLIEVTQDDYILDAACGSGGFLVKAMSNMMKEAGGYETAKAKEIRRGHLFGIEFDEEIYALACANMLIHKDGKTNLEQLDTRTQKACSWIEQHNITKVLMNPPFENKYGCVPIVSNVLNSVPPHTECAFIMPDKKLEKVSANLVNGILSKHTLKKIVKLPEETFNAGITTSIFIFETGVPQNDKEIFGCYIEEDGLETVKNKGRHDVKNKWQTIEDYWVDVIHKQSGDSSVQWIKPSEHLSYQMPVIPFSITEQDFNKTSLDYLMFEEEIEVSSFAETLVNKVLYANDVNKFVKTLSELKETEPKDVDISDWEEYPLTKLFEITGSTTTAKRALDLDSGGSYPYITTAATNNGIGGYSEVYTDEGGIITVDSAVLGVCFYQENNFTASDHVEKLIPLFDGLDKYKALFLVSVLNANAKVLRYAYNEKRSQKALKKEVIKLPAKDGEPDWEAMEEYMKAIEINQSKKLEILKEAING